MAVDGDDLLALVGVADVDEGVLQGGDQRVVHDLGVLAHGDGVVVDGGGDADDVGLLPDGGLAVELGVPALGIIAAGVGIGHEHVDLTGGKTREGAGVGIGLHGAAQVRDALAVVILQPQGGIDVARGRGGSHDAPVGAVKVLPGQLLAAVDLGSQLLTLIGGTGDDERAVGDRLLLGRFGGLTVVPVLGVVGILAQTVAGRGQDDLGAVVIENIGAARDQTDVDGTGLKTLADGFVGGADGDLDLADLIALLGKLVLEQLLEGLGRGDDLLRLAGRNERHLQRFDLLRAALAVLLGFVSGGVLAAAAGQQAEAHDQREQKCKTSFHCAFLHNVSFAFLRRMPRRSR